MHVQLWPSNIHLHWSISQAVSQLPVANASYSLTIIATGDDEKQHWHWLAEVVAKQSPTADKSSAVGISMTTVIPPPVAGLLNVMTMLNETEDLFQQPVPAHPKCPSI